MFEYGATIRSYVMDYVCDQMAQFSSRIRLKEYCLFILQV